MTFPQDIRRMDEHDKIIICLDGYSLPTVM